MQTLIRIKTFLPRDKTLETVADIEGESAEKRNTSIVHTYTTPQKVGLISRFEQPSNSYGSPFCSVRLLYSVGLNIRDTRVILIPGTHWRHNLNGTASFIAHGHI